MFRLTAASRALREAVPGELVVVVWAVTLLGSAKFLMVALSLAYWNLERRREELLALLSVAFVALSVTLVLKYGFDLPRPPESVQRYPVGTTEVGFPSGHAIAATVVYGGAVLVMDRHRDPAAVFAAGALAVVVGLSRVVLGVHYLGDVLAGWVVGLVVLAAVAALTERAAVYGFALAAVLSVPALILTGVNGDTVLALGGSLGGFAGALWRSGAAPFRTGVERAAVNLAGLAVIAGAFLVESAVEGILVAAAAVNFLLAFGIVAVPTVVGRVDSLGPRSRTDW